MSALLTEPARTNGSPDPAVSAIQPGPRQIRAKLSLSAWSLLRGRPTGQSGNLRGQLGGAQIGMRFKATLLSLGPDISAGPTLRISAPLFGVSGREIAPGVAIRLSGRVPVELIAERRVALTRNSRDRFALVVATGIGDARLPARLQLNGYAQAGMAGTQTRETFAGGSLDITRAIRIGDGSDLAVGLGTWAEAQRGIARADIGPVVDLRLKGFPRPMRLSVQWRFRVAGKASPPSGPALVVGTDF